MSAALRDPGRLWRTVRSLKPIQLWGRVARRLRRAKPDLSPPPPLRPLTGPWVAPVEKTGSLIGDARVRFLNQEGSILRPKDWNDPDRDKLWLYNLHYFDDLTAEGAGGRAAMHAALIARWMAENPPGAGNGWEPYPTSLRIVNWIKRGLGGAAMTPAELHSLAVQARWLAGHVEWHLLGNHLLANAKALVFAGLWFDGPEAKGWLGAGLEIYRRQIPEQVLDDGGHFERSPMYHAIILEDLMDLWNLARAYRQEGRAGFAALPAVATLMRAWLRAMSHPDGRIGFFNDAAFGIAAEPSALEAYAAGLGLEPLAPARAGMLDLRPSGYARLERGGAAALLDMAPIGPDYLPGHAHADTLSFELSVGAERVVVNGGTSVYGTGPERQAERGTAAHSTVEIDGRDSSEVWAGFRVGRRARVFDVEAGEAEDGALVAAAAHDGYRWRPGRPVHRRTWRMTDTTLEVFDDLGGHADSAVARFHLGEGVEAAAAPDGLSGTLTLPSGRAVQWRTSAPATIEASVWRPEFGRRVSTRQLVVRLLSKELRTEFAW